MAWLSQRQGHSSRNSSGNCNWHSGQKLVQKGLEKHSLRVFLHVLYQAQELNLAGWIHCANLEAIAPDWLMGILDWTCTFGLDSRTNCPEWECWNIQSSWLPGRQCQGRLDHMIIIMWLIQADTFQVQLQPVDRRTTHLLFLLWPLLFLIASVAVYDPFIPVGPPQLDMP